MTLPYVATCRVDPDETVTVSAVNYDYPVGSGRVFLDLTGENLILSAKKARKLAKAIKRAADLAEGIA